MSFSYNPGLVLVMSFSYTPDVILVWGFSNTPDVSFNPEFLSNTPDVSSIEERFLHSSCQF